MIIRKIVLTGTVELLVETDAILDAVQVCVKPNNSKCVVLVLKI